ncbi:MAG: SipW-dependent-type signal peptide-containing protein [Nakamurella sp.]
MSVVTDPTVPTAPVRRRDRRRKFRAVLAAGLVLGVGGAVTLAAWNDSEYATGTFTAGTFNM